MVLCGREKNSLPQTQVGNFLLWAQKSITILCDLLFRFMSRIARLFYRGVLRQEKIRFTCDFLRRFFFFLLFWGSRRKESARKQRKTAVKEYLALVQNVSRFGTDDSGGDADDDVESVTTSGRKWVMCRASLIYMTVADWSHVLECRKFVWLGSQLWCETDGRFYDVDLFKRKKETHTRVVLCVSSVFTTALSNFR